MQEICRTLGELTIEEIVLSFTGALINERLRVAARFQIEHRRAQGSPSRSGWKDFESPLGPAELEEIRWYLERYPGWPFGTFRERARRLEANLLAWGRELYQRTLGLSSELAAAWHRKPADTWRVIVAVDDPGLSGESDNAGAATLLAIPWELLADEGGYLFEGNLRAQIARHIPREGTKEPLPIADVLRILLVIARPEEQGVGFIDPRTSARALIEALAPLGHRAQLEVVEDGTFLALREALARAEQQGCPFHIVHFDGHGTYNKRAGLGMLCFESAADARENKLRRRVDLVDAECLGILLREQRVPLFVLEACQTAVAEEKVTASVAARLLRAGVGSVLAMTHTVLVETTRRFVGRFYERLASGEQIGAALVAAKHYLQDDSYRGEVGGHGGLHLQDWFVPVLFQGEDGDRQLLQAGSMVDPQALAGQRKMREGDLPSAPDWGFLGRARELLAVQRQLRGMRHLILLGEGGQGKTALAVECARWLLDLRYFDRVAFASVEDLPSARVLLDRLGRQLVPRYSIALEEGKDTDEQLPQRACLPLERALAEQRILLIVDNLESILPAPGQSALPELDEILAILNHFAQIGGTRLLLTSRELPPPPLNRASFRLGRLSKREGREILTGLLARAGKAPAGDTDEGWVDELIEGVGGHARSLVLLAPLVTEQGLKVTAESVSRMLTELEARNPGNRELSLLASVRLSLDRLPGTARRQVRAFAVFQGAVHVVALAHVLEVAPDEALALCQSLVAVGLANASSQGPYFLPDPGLCRAVVGELSDQEFKQLKERWLIAMLGTIGALGGWLFKDARLAIAGTQLALKDILAALEEAEKAVHDRRLPVDLVVDKLMEFHEIIIDLGRPAVLSRLGEMRRRLQPLLEGWSAALFNSLRSEITDLFSAGNVSEAVRAAEELTQRAKAAGNSEFIAPALSLFGEALIQAGRFLEALKHLDEAETIFVELAQSGNDSVASSLGTLVQMRGNALESLGRFEEAAQSYENGVQIAEKWGDRRSAAVSRAQLGTVRFEQGRVVDALNAFEQARLTFQALQEPESVALAWHQIGRVFQAAQQWDRAEEAYQQALRIRVEFGNKRKQAFSLGQIGLLYWETGRLEESAQLLRRSASLCEELGDDQSYAVSLNNLALPLKELGRLEEAREAAAMAARLNTAFGDAAGTWRAWSLLEEIEILAGRPTAALEARSRSIESYLGYRQRGGEPQSSATRLITKIGAALQAYGADQARRLIPPAEDFEERSLPLRGVLIALVEGSRDPSLAQDPRLDFSAAAELSLVLRALAGSETCGGGVLLNFRRPERKRD